MEKMYNDVEVKKVKNLPRQSSQKGRRKRHIDWKPRVEINAVR